MSNLDDFRANVKRALTVAELWLAEMGYKAGRDRREPGWLQKQQAENELARLFMRLFNAQRKRVQQWAETDPQWTKAVVIPDTVLLNEDDDGEGIAALIRQLTRMVRHGIQIFGEKLSFDIDYDKINTRALAVARRAGLEMIRRINDTTKDSLRQALVSFVDTPGFTIGDIMASLGPTFDEDRALRIAVTETTRVYSEATQEAAAELAREFPNAKIVKEWYTNQDDLVCPICSPLPEMGRIPVDQMFDEENEVDWPPAHVNCRCWAETDVEFDND